MSDSFTEVTREGWLSRIGGSIKGVLVGGAFFVGSFPLLVWNEGRAVKTARSLEEGAGAVVSVAAANVEPGREGRLVHASGEATTTETLADPDFGVSVPALRLQRVVEMYQWKQEEKSETRNKIGGGTETVRTYSYTKTWSERPIDSERFELPGGHQNPAALPFESRGWTAQRVTLGAYRLSEDQVARLDRTEPVSVGASALPPAMSRKVRAVAGQNMFYSGSDPASPAIGDVRVTFKKTPPAVVSVVARQVGDTFEPYRARAGGTVDLLEYGQKSADAMFQAAQEANATLTWIVRAGGFIVMFLGLLLVFKPISVLGDVIPILGTLLGAGVAIFAGAVSAALSLITIAISWLFFRPLVAIALLLVAGGAMAGFTWLAAQRRKTPAAA